MRKRAGALVGCLLLLWLATGCWSSKEIEDLALYTGLALDVGQPAPVEKEFEEKGATYPKRNKMMATLQIVPTKSVGNREKRQSGQSQQPYVNVSASGDSILEVFRQFSLRLDRPIIGHHLKVIVISDELLQKQKIEQLMDFILRDNDIRPSTMVYISQGSAREALMTNQTNEVPSLRIRGMIRNKIRTSKVLDPVTLAKLDGFMYAKKSFVLQNVVKGDGEILLSGAGIIKGATGHWIGTLNQEETECLAWVRNEGETGVIKAYDEDNESLTYELKSMKSKITSQVDGDEISFRVAITTDGRLNETWSERNPPSTQAYADRAAEMIEQRLDEMMRAMIRKLQTTYKADVIGFGDRLAIEHPAVWRSVKERWDEVFSQAKVTFTYELSITDFGSFSEQ